MDIPHQHSPHHTPLLHNCSPSPHGPSGISQRVLWHQDRVSVLGFFSASWEPPHLVSLHSNTELAWKLLRVAKERKLNLRPLYHVASEANQRTLLKNNNGDKKRKK